MQGLPIHELAAEVPVLVCFLAIVAGFLAYIVRRDKQQAEDHQARQALDERRMDTLSELQAACHSFQRSLTDRVTDQLNRNSEQLVRNSDALDRTAAIIRRLHAEDR